MKSVNLVIGQKLPLVQQKTVGPYTLFVRAVKNWPQPAAPLFPAIPLDIVVIVNIQTGGHWQSQNIQLPCNGLILPLNCAEIEVWVYYWAGQGLGVPYAGYIVEGGIQKGWTNPTPVVFTDGYDPSATTQFLPKTSFQSDTILAKDPSVSPYELVPQYAKECRIITDNYATMVMLDVTNQYGGYFGAEEFRGWRTLTPFSYKWQVAIPYAAYSAGTTPSVTTVEFK